jgi:hypothetical protein
LDSRLIPELRDGHDGRQKRMDAPERVEAVSLDMSPAFIKASR